MSKSKKIFRIILGIFLVTMIAGTAWNWRNIQMVATYNPIFLPSWYSEPETQGEARRQDLEHLRKFTDIDRSFSNHAKAEFIKLIDETEAKADTISDAEFYLMISKAAALADNGHTNTSSQPLQRQFNSIGAKLFWFADGLFIVRADADHGALVGSRVLQIEGRSVEAVAKTLRQYRGGPSSWRKLAMPMMIETPAIMHAAGLSKSPDMITFSLQKSNGDKAEAVFKASLDKEAAGFPFRQGWMTLQTEILPDENDEWVRSLDGQSKNLATYLKATDAPLFQPIAGNGHYVRTQSGFGSDTQSTEELLEESLKGIDNASLDYLVVDNRWNAGGDYLQSIEFAKLAPGKIKKGGRLYIVVGPQTFSAAVVSTAMLKYYGGKKAMIVGTPMGDREQFWAERGMGFQLPNSEFYVNYATGYHDWEKGCTGQKYCFTFNLEHEVPAGSLAPAQIIDPSYADYASGRDIVMDWIKSDQKSVD